MSTSFQKPENALKKAEQLIYSGQNLDALNILYTTIIHRKFKLNGWDLNSETIMMEYVRLCVELEKLKYVREGLHYYRALTQQHNVLSLAKVMKELRELSEKKLDNVISKTADKACLASGVDDLEEDETPESLMLSTLQIEPKDKSAKELHNALLCCWESYKIIMDFSRFAPKIDTMYHDTAQRALEFCRIHKRHTEFKRLCDTIRLHYNNFHRYRDRSDFEPFLHAENHLATKLVQMDAAAELNLWSQCFQTAEDIVSLGLHDLVQRALSSRDNVNQQARAILLSQTSIFYEKLAQIFLVSDQSLFHASAILKNLFHTRQHKKNVTKELQTRLSNLATLAILSIPILQKATQSPSELEFQKKLSGMIGHSVIPTRASMQSVIENRGILNSASPCVQALYMLIEKDINCMVFCFEAETLIREIEKIEELACYVKTLKVTVFQKLITVLSRIYTSMSIDFFINSICNESFISWVEVETMIVQLVHQNFSKIRLDYSNRVIYFGDAVANAGSVLKNSLLNIAKVLSTVIQQLPPEYVPKSSANMLHSEFHSDFEYKLLLEKERISLRKKLLADKRLQQEQEQQAKEEARITEEKERQRKEEIEEQSRKEAAFKYHESIRRQEERQQLRMSLSQQILNELKLISEKAVGKIIIKGKPIEDITIDQIARNEYTYEDYEKAQEELRFREQQGKMRQHRLESKKAEHIIRALREEESPLIDLWKKDTINADLQLQNSLLNEYEIEREKQINHLKKQSEKFKPLKHFKDAWIAEKLSQREKNWKEQLENRRKKTIDFVKKAIIRKAKTRYEESLEAKALKLKKQKEAEKRQKLDEAKLWRRSDDQQKKKTFDIPEGYKDQKKTDNVYTPYQPAVVELEPDWSSLRNRPTTVVKTEKKFTFKPSVDVTQDTWGSKFSSQSRFNTRSSSPTSQSWRHHPDPVENDISVKRNPVFMPSNSHSFINKNSFSSSHYRNSMDTTCDWAALQEKRNKALNDMNKSTSFDVSSLNNVSNTETTNVSTNADRISAMYQQVTNERSSIPNNSQFSPLNDGFTTVTKKTKLKTGK